MKKLTEALAKHILVLDGAMGTMIQRLKLTEGDFRGERFARHTTQLSGNNDILCLTNPEAISRIHRDYLDAGADIISTNSFNANSISQADYSTSDLVEEINLSAARLARNAADEYMKSHSDRAVFVAGSVGPTNRAASISPRVDDPAYRNIDFDVLSEAYHEQVSALWRGGVDVILFETVFDTLNLKAGLDAVRKVSQEIGEAIPVMVSATIAGRSGRILSGQTLSALWTSIAPYDNIISFGLNCSWGARDMKPYVEEIASLTDRAVSCHPNAGLPDENGLYSEPAEEFALAVKELMSKSFINIIGGCCGTGPEHIKLISQLAKAYSPRIAPSLPTELRVSGLETLAVTPENNFVNIGERCNVAGSRKFLRLIKEGQYDEALAIARKQVEDGAQILDINMDDSMIDARKEMIHFLRLIGSDPDVARVPVMIDSSDWTVLEAGLKCVQGKPIVNSISLKGGEDEFVNHALIIRSLGAAVVVMAFDEVGQADTFERKIEICSRAYRLLTEKVGFSPEDIIFDPKIMAVATGIEEHDLYGRDFIRAAKWIKDNLPGAKVSGGVSNLSFAFRGHNRLREAMHAVFLYHAITAGLDMAIVNPSSSVTYSDVDPILRDVLDDLFLNGSHEAAEKLTELVTVTEEDKSEHAEASAVDRSAVPISERLRNALIKGDDSHLAEDLQEATQSYQRAIDIIDGPLMEGVATVGELFGEGKMFLPQVVKTARVMKRAVDLLKPRIESEKAEKGNSVAGTVLFATVKGDVHDIGKNIVSIVLECNNYRVIDLGVMVPAETIVEKAIAEKPDVICLSGLITPSLGEMANVADKLEAAGVKIPLIVGGATTSRLHTALKLAGRLSAPVVHATDAAQNPVIISRLLNKDTHDNYIKELESDYEELRRKYSEDKKELLSLSEARRHKLKLDWDSYEPLVPAKPETTVLDLPLDKVVGLINWRMFFNFWKVTGDFIDDFPYDRCEHCCNQWLLTHSDNPKAAEALKLYNDANAIINDLRCYHDVIRALTGFFDAYSDNSDNLHINGLCFPMLRRQKPNADGICLCATDFVMPEQFFTPTHHDYVGAFVVSAAAPSLIEKFSASDDNYSLLLLRSVLDRLAEAGSEYLHKVVRTDLWGYVPEENLPSTDLFAAKYQGIRPAMGYPMTPDLTLNLKLSELLPFDKIGVTLTENGAMNPPSTVCGLYISHPASHYFMVGRIGRDQISDYADRRGVTAKDVEAILGKNS